jgi:hypothetical protein
VPGGLNATPAVNRASETAIASPASTHTVIRSSASGNVDDLERQLRRWNRLGRWSVACARADQFDRQGKPVQPARDRVLSDGEPTSLGAQLSFVNSRSACNDVAGSVDLNGNGLYTLDISKHTEITGCVLRTKNSAPWESLLALPAYYNAHDRTSTELPVVTNTPRVVTAKINTEVSMKTNIDRASRNLAEAVAAKAREDGIYVFTLGMGNSLKSMKGVDNEKGEAFMKCMANVADGPSRCYKPTQPVGMYCYAATDADLTPCFSKLASAILRISK